MEIVNFNQIDDILLKNIDNNYCIVLEDVVIDNSYTKECTPIFYHKGKRIQKFLDRIHGDWRKEADIYIDTSKYANKISVINDDIKIDEYKDSLFLLFDIFNNNVGHFLLECFSRSWYFDNYNWGNDVKVATVELHDQINQMPSLNHLLHIKYKDVHEELKFGKIYHIKKLVLPGYYYMIGDEDMPKRLYDFCDGISNSVKNISGDYTYISRQDIVHKDKNANKHWHNRVLKNEKQLIELLRLNQYDIYEMKSLKSGEEIINCFKNKKKVSLLMGAAAHLCIFCSPNTEVNLIYNKRFSWAKHWFIQLAKNRNIKINYIVPESIYYDDEASSYIVDKEKINVPWEIVDVESIVKLL